MVSFLKKLFKRDYRAAYLKQQTEIDTPWSTFEVVGFDELGQIKVEFNWNEAFIDELDRLGFTAETPEDTVQLFFYASQMKPMDLAGNTDDGDQTVQSSQHPGLSPNTNRLAR